jgi:hypothetical protein
MKDMAMARDKNGISTHNYSKTTKRQTANGTGRAYSERERCPETTDGGAEGSLGPLSRSGLKALGVSLAFESIQIQPQTCSLNDHKGNNIQNMCVEQPMVRV